MKSITVVTHYVITGETKPEKQFKYLKEYKQKFEELNNGLVSNLSTVNIFVPTNEKEGIDIQTINKE